VLAQTTDEIEIICATLRDLNSDPAWAFAHCSPAETSRLTHGYHRYPAKFIPQLVDLLLDEYLPSQTTAKPLVVDDPFSGSGTTAVCAISRGHRAIGTDISEVAWLIARAKATPIEPARLQASVAHLMERLADRRIEPLIPPCERLDYWFPAEQKEELGRILSAIKTVEDEDAQTLFLCGFSHILKNCSRWSMKSSKPTIAKDKRIPKPLPVFQRQIKKMVERNRQFWEITPVATRTNIADYLDLRCGDARRQPAADNSVDMIVTSSPYVTSYEYADLHQLSALWLEYARDLRQWRRKFIGTAFSPLGGESHSYLAGQIVDSVLARNASLAAEISTYFFDMEQVFAESFRILKPGARACYVIGNTSLAGVAILNAEVFVESMQLLGFDIERVIKREIPSKILPQTRDASTGRFVGKTGEEVLAYPHEYIIVARKP
jgi:DNA modification methylase